MWFAWDDIWRYLTNPFYLLFVIVLAGAWVMGGAALWATYRPIVMPVISKLAAPWSPWWTATGNKDKQE